MAGYIFNYKFAIAGALLNAKAALYRVYPSRTNDRPSWEGKDGDITTVSLKKPITDRSYWEGRYALTVVTLQMPTGESLEIDDIVINLSRQKQIIKTALTGLDGTIKEYICQGDYDISMTLGIVATDVNGAIIDEYPEEGVREVKKFLDLNEQLKVQSPFLDLFDISRIVITGYSLKQSTESNRQVIEIKALSDEDFEIRSTEY